MKAFAMAMLSVSLVGPIGCPRRIATSVSSR